MDHRLVREQLLGRTDVDDAAGVEHHRVAGDALHNAEILLDEQHGRELRDTLEHAGHLGDEQRRETLGGLIDEQNAVVVQERTGDRDHLLLAAGERACELLSALLQLGKQVVDKLIPRLGVTLGEAEILVDREARENIAVLRDVADSASHDLVGRRRCEPSG